LEYISRDLTYLHSFAHLFAFALEKKIGSQAQGIPSRIQHNADRVLSNGMNKGKVAAGSVGDDRLSNHTPLIGRVAHATLTYKTREMR
jgi:hypothetical protein